jgi:hypothetical protein
MDIRFTSKPSAATGWLTMQRRSVIAMAARYLGALAVLAIGVDHLEQYAVDNYSTVPTIGTLFFLNFVSAVLVTVGLILPVGRAMGRYADAFRAVVALSGIGVGVLSLAGLFVSETTGLFGFVEHGYRMAIALAIVAEVAATILLVIFLAANGTGVEKIRAGSP